MNLTEHSMKQPSGANECGSETDVIHCDPDRFPLPRGFFLAALLTAPLLKPGKSFFPRSSLPFPPPSVCTQQRHKTAAASRGDTLVPMGGSISSATNLTAALQK
jgi:hypothetical protein